MSGAGESDELLSRGGSVGVGGGSWWRSFGSRMKSESFGCQER